MRIRGLAIVAVVGLAACGGSSKSSSSSSSSAVATTAAPSAAADTSTSAALGHDQASTPFCKSLGKANTISDPTKDPALTRQLLDALVSQSPTSLRSDIIVLAEFIRSELAGGSGPTTTISSSAATQLLSSLNKVGVYASAHCGITLNLPGQ
jgi:hypothetical protein